MQFLPCFAYHLLNMNEINSKKSHKVHECTHFGLMLFFLCSGCKITVSYTNIPKKYKIMQLLFSHFVLFRKHQFFLFRKHLGDRHKKTLGVLFIIKANEIHTEPNCETDIHLSVMYIQINIVFFLTVDEFVLWLMCYRLIESNVYL